MTKKYYEPQYGSPEYDMESHLEARKGERKALQRLKNDRTRARVVSQARKVQDKVKISPVADLTSKHFSPKHRADMNQLKKDIKEIRDFANKPVRDYRQEFRQSIKPNVTYRTQGKQDLLEGKPRKTTVSAKAGAGMQMLKAQMRRFGAKQWWQSKTH